MDYPLFRDVGSEWRLRRCYSQQRSTRQWLRITLWRLSPHCFMDLKCYEVSVTLTTLTCALLEITFAHALIKRSLCFDNISFVIRAERASHMRCPLIKSLRFMNCMVFGSVGLRLSLLGLVRISVLFSAAGLPRLRGLVEAWGLSRFMARCPCEGAPRRS